MIGGEGGGSGCGVGGCTACRRCGANAHVTHQPVRSWAHGNGGCGGRRVSGATQNHTETCGSAWRVCGGWR
eukprot:12603251-Prorocentrum_lima.AAC.1